jgi:hypothetical protein
MRLISCFILVFTFTQISFGQASFFTKSDSINSKRATFVGAGIGSVWFGSMFSLQQIWYKNIPKSAFHTFDDSRNWLQMDKAGHVYTANKISTLSGDLFKWSGMKSSKAAIIGGSIGLGYQTSLELMDAFSQEWGFSWSDMTANFIGTSLYVGQELAWKEQRFLLKFSYHPTKYAALRPEVLGSNFQERLLKDYNGQTYWLTFNPFLFSKNSSFPKWLCLSLGYSADAKIVGDKETFSVISSTGTTIYNAKREFLLSFDIDFSRVPIKRPWLKAVVKQLNYLKIPFPALILSNGKLSASGLYF